MNRKQLNFLSMCALVHAWMKSHKTEVVTHPKLEELYTQLGELIEAINQKSTVQKTVITGITRRKDAVEILLIDLLLQVKDGLEAFAVSSGNLELKSVTAISESRVRLARDNDLLLIAKNMQNNLRQYLSGLEPFNVSATDAANFDNAIASFEASLTKPREALVGKVVATQNLTELFEIIKTEVLPAIDSLMAPQKRTLPVLYAEYLSTRKLVDISSGRAAGPKANQPPLPGTNA
jgi:hypothetical protein